MTPQARTRKAKALGRKLLRARAKRGHSAQQLHDAIKAKGFEEPPTVRTIQRHEIGEMLPWPATWEMYAAVYEELQGVLDG